MTDPNAVEILLVEDNEQDAELTIEELRERNFANNLHHVKDGEKALDFIFGTGAYKNRSVQNGPKVVLLDIKLPKVDGIEVLRRIKSDDRTKKIPVVILTSSKEEVDVLRSYQLGVNSYIVKPVGFEAFSKAISELGFYWMALNNLPK